ncbi:uncharacterized protein HMPREF1120_04391 [Exophiala dermatitidis NIH/UT8656]|uniref:Uncharacterized protein n=1 Tax=Exophiala dermatitidis (strain ATCC 34100 / CBS 525.76 / NIH/UT8656) TaxID=858893 RepID=H6BZX1_EXODN|nr:uncharacterized protein HMPREF1120_04391 [Exophiala dermatitidis NIH/UT8656]EHY56306.1 hypothetical protein HMPREF1120_04391 [Exophiala dermatitidis NIH/UT8656]
MIVSVLCDLSRTQSKAQPAGISSPFRPTTTTRSHSRQPSRSARDSTPGSSAPVSLGAQPLASMNTSTAASTDDGGMAGWIHLQKVGYPWATIADRLYRELQSEARGSLTCKAVNTHDSYHRIGPRHPTGHTEND